MRRAAALALALLLVACKKSKGPEAKRLWLGPAQGCVATAGRGILGPVGCWGANDAGQLGDGTTVARLDARAATFPGGTPRELAFGARHACGLFPDGAWCWGANDRGQRGVPAAAAPSPSSPSPSRLAASDPRAIAAGAAHTCVVEGAELRPRCFGADDEGQLGGDWGDARAAALALGEAHTCVLHAGGGVRCRGRAVAAPAGDVLAGVDVRAIAAGGEHTCALLADATVRCWGRNDRGQLGDGATDDHLEPRPVLELRGVVGLAAGAKHTCARLANGSVACWGDNARHQLADGTTIARARPVGLRGLLGVEEVAAGGDSTCARLGDGYVRCWGQNDLGQLGDGTTVEHDVPMPIRLR